MVLLVGAAGFLGPAVLKKLLESDNEINCLIRDGSNRSKLTAAAGERRRQLAFISGDLNSIASITQSLKNISQAVYMVDLEHAGLVKNFLDAAQKAKLKRVVFISSTTVLLPLKSKVRDKKLSSEKLIKNSGLDWTILRPTMTFGSTDDMNFSRMLKFIKKRGFFIIFGNGNNLIQPVYIEDVAGAVSDVLENRKTYKKIYNLAGKKPLKYKQMLAVMQQKLKKPFRIMRLPLGISRLLVSVYSLLSPNPMLAPGQIDRMGIDKSYSYREARQDFGFSPASFEEGIESLIDDLKA